MRHLVADEAYYEYLDGLDDVYPGDISSAVVKVLEEFPNLRPEEAKSVCADWRAKHLGAKMETDSLDSWSGNVPGRR